MDPLLIFFALPVATVILAIVFQKILQNPLLVAATFFAVYLIVTFSAFDASFLVYAILYTILAYVTAVLTKAICNLLNSIRLSNEANAQINNISNNINTANLIPTNNGNCCRRRRQINFININT